MSYHWIVPLTAALLNAVLGALVFFHEPRRTINQLFACLSLALVFWNLNIFVLYYFADPAAALYWSGVFRIGTLLAGPIALNLFVVFSESRTRLVRYGLWSSYALALFLVAANVSGRLVLGLREYAWGFHPVGQPLYALVPVSVAFGLILSIFVLVDVVRFSRSPRKRQQAQLWLAGAAIAWPLAMTNLIASFGIPFYPLGNFANVAYAMFIAYGISRYRLLDIDVVVTKGISFLLLAVLLIGPVFVITLLLQHWLFGFVNYDFSFFLLFLFFIVVIAAPRLRETTEQRIERSLFRDKHEYRTTLRQFTRNIVRILDRQTLLEEIARTLQSALGLQGISVFVAPDSEKDFVMEYSLGLAPKTRRVERGHPLASWLASRGQAVLREEAEALAGDHSGIVAQTFAENDWEVCIGLSVSGTPLGFLALGPKTSLNVISSVDLDLLDTLAGEAAIALDNARLYEELKRSRDVIQREGRLSAIGTLAAGIAHEIRNPLVSIQTFFQLAPGRLNDEEFVNGFLKLTEGEVRRICDLITELLNFAKSPTRSRGPVNLNEIIASVVTLLTPHGRKHGVDVTSGGLTDIEIRADADQLKQVLVNITLNGIEATQREGQVAIRTEIVEQEGRKYCEVSIQDNGCGIPIEQAEDIFTPFFTTKSKGTGLGLAIAHQIVAEHGGFITMRSNSDQGTRFGIALPIDDPPASFQHESGTLTGSASLGAKDHP